MENRCGQSNERICADAQRKAKSELASPPKTAVIACEGACIKGEVARVAANILAYQLQKDSSVRICLGDAATGNSGMIDLVNRAPEIVAIEGCPLQCGTEILKTRIPDLKATVINASELYTYDRQKYFDIFDLPYEEIIGFAEIVAQYTQDQAFLNPGALPTEKTCCGN